MFTTPTEQNPLARLTKRAIAFGVVVNRHNAIINLTSLRQRLEQETGKPIDALNFSVAAILDDVITALELGEDARRKILGRGYEPIRGLTCD